ncbi:MAG: hypothetical protein SVY53_04170 [Chloroflexota bacterium]|nr:hypothetical protein [Chloroflexota bacterium]
MKSGDRVRMATFNGTKHANGQVINSENYWKLIGCTGTVEQDPNESTIYSSFSKDPRVLVRFDRELKCYNLIAHNSIKNSLWILVSDLEIA